MTTTTGQETYGRWLSRKMDEGGLTTRALAKRMNPENPEIARRTLRRYLADKQVPREPAKREIALHLSSDEIGPNEDDAEDDLLADLDRRVQELSLLIQQARNANAPTAHLSGSAAGALTRKG